MMLDNVSFHLRGNAKILRGLGRVNFLLGKNGCGKSSILRTLDQQTLSGLSRILVKYISPERAGVLRWEPDVDNQISRNTSYLRQDRNANQVGKFRAQAISNYRKLEYTFLRAFESSQSEDDKFDKIFSKLNGLLDHIELRRIDNDFEIFEKGTDNKIAPENVSSGEAELIALGVECLEFVYKRGDFTSRYLLLDEPDAHLHPDLQERLASFIFLITKDRDIQVFISSHSPALLSGFLKEGCEIKVAFITNAAKDIDFINPSGSIDKLVPIFGAHPLSNTFNKVPPMLVEGEDDERIWQQAYRSSQGVIRVYPCPVGSISNLSDNESLLAQLIGALYEHGIAYSLRDGDDQIGIDLNDFGSVKRFRLNCRSSENLFLSNEVLSSLNTDWSQMRGDILRWLGDNNNHAKWAEMKSFVDGGFDRRCADLKEVRNILVALTASARPWEVSVGKIIGQMPSMNFSSDENSIWNYLGSKIIEGIIGKSLQQQGKNTDSLVVEPAKAF